MESKHLNKLFPALLTTACVCIASATTAGLVYRVVTALPDNHIGGDIRILWVAVILFLTLAIKSSLNRKLGHAAARGLSAATLATCLWLLDHYNLLVEYEVWLGRGMPSAWQVLSGQLATVPS